MPNVSLFCYLLGIVSLNFGEILWLQIAPHIYHMLQRLEGLFLKINSLGIVRITSAVVFDLLTSYEI